MDVELKSALLRVLPFLLVILAVRIGIRQKRLQAADLGFQAPVSVGRFFAWYSFFVLFVLATEFTLFRFGLLEVSHWHHDFLPSIIRLAGMVVLAPVAEEIIFRGLFIQKLTRQKVNVHLSILIQAVVFVLLHSFAYENTLSSNIGIAQSFVDAMVYGYARVQTQSLYTSMAMHSTGNLIAVMEQFFL